MRFSTMLRHFREGTKNIVRNGWMSLASISSIGISLFILGAFVLLALNLNQLAGQLESQVQIRVYLELNTDQAKINELNNRIRNMPEVSRVQFISKDEGLEIFRSNLGEDGKELLGDIDSTNNPLPDSFTVEVVDPQTISFVAKKIQAIGNTDGTSPFSSVKYGKGTVEKLFEATNAIRLGTIVIVVGLAVSAMFLISNTIKVTIIARRREIGIMKLVGATNHFIRWPFFIEGALIGLCGSLITTILLLTLYSRIVQITQYELGLMMIRLVTAEDSVVPVAGLLIGIGTLIGVLGSTISIRKYLKV